MERIYWSVSAQEVMSSNPGHYVALVVASPTEKSDTGAQVKHLKLLRPDDTLLIGQVYRLISFEGEAICSRQYDTGVFFLFFDKISIVE